MAAGEILQSEQGGKIIDMVDDQRRRINRALAVTGIVIGAGIGLFVVGKVVRNARYNKALAKTDDTADPAYFAQRILEAFNPDSPFGWGTDEVQLRKTIQAVPHRKFWDQVKVEYHKLSRGRNLLRDLESELSRTEKREISLILSQLPKDAREAANHDPRQVTTAKLQAWAMRIKAAADYEYGPLWPYGTDEDAIYAVLDELPTAATLCALDRIYRRLYHKSVFRELTDELDSSELARVYRIIMNKPDAYGKSFHEIINLCQG
jgi:hypothetical protein